MTSSASLPQDTWALNTISGAVSRVSPHLFEHPIFGPVLVEVEPNTKSYKPELWKPTTAAEYIASQKKTKNEDKK